MFSEKATYRDEDLFFNGIYQVVKVESKFDNGQFLQTLTCVRMNNQQGEGAWDWWSVPQFGLAVPIWRRFQLHQ